MTKREALTKALKVRKRLMRLSKGRKDWGPVALSIGYAEVFLGSYPVATDERVKEWAHKHSAWVRVLVPSNRNDLLNIIME